MHKIKEYSNLFIAGVGVKWHSNENCTKVLISANIYTLRDINIRSKLRDLFYKLCQVSNSISLNKTL